MFRYFPECRFWLAGLLAIGSGTVAPTVQAQTVAYYRFENGVNQGTVGTVTDSGPNHLHGTSAGTSPLTYSFSAPDIFGGTNLLSLDARGSNNFVRVNDNPAFHVQGDLTVETFARLNSPYNTVTDNSTNWIVTKRNTLNGGTYLSAWGIYYYVGSSQFGVEIGCYGSGDTGVYVTSTAPAIQDTKWHHIAFVLKRKAQGLNDAFTLYVDGVQQGQAVGDFGDLRYNSDELIIGAANFSTEDGTGYFNRSFDGYIDEVRITAAALAPTQFLLNSFPVTGSVMLDGVTDLSKVKVPIAPLTFTLRPHGGGTPIMTAASLTPVVGNPAVGTFTLPPVTRGSYDLLIKGSKQLAVRETPVNVNDAAPLGGVLTLPGGDADGSNIVNFDDFLVLLNAFGIVYDPNNSGSGYDATADFNYDGVVNFDDFLILLNNFGATGSS